jgi:multidrug efflux system membrane fusion protein
VVSRRNVNLGPLETGLRVVRDGLSASDWVVVRGLQRARPGLKVQMNQVSIAQSSVPGGSKDAE